MRDMGAMAAILKAAILKAANKPFVGSRGVNQLMPHSVFIYITRLASNEIFSPSNKIHREVGRAKDLTVNDVQVVALELLANIPLHTPNVRWQNRYCKNTLNQESSNEGTLHSYRLFQLQYIPPTPSCNLVTFSAKLQIPQSNIH